MQCTTGARPAPAWCPMAAVIGGAAITPPSHKLHPVDRASSVTPTTVALSLLAHALAVAAVLYLSPIHAESPEGSSETAIALVFAPVPTAPPPPSEVVSPMPDSTTPAIEPDHSEPAHNQPTSASPQPPAVQHPLTMSAPTDTMPSDPESRPVVPAHEAQPIPEAPRRPAPPPKPAVTAHAPGPRTSSPFNRPAPSNAFAPTNAEATGPLVPPRPVAGMETNRAPVYPAIARQRGEQGRVVLRVNVSAGGTPVEVSVMDTSGHPILDSAALSAVRQWHFIPATQAGKSVAAVADIPVQFRLDN
jgi:periplasmic protein TonB